MYQRSHGGEAASVQRSCKGRSCGSCSCPQMCVLPLVLTPCALCCECVSLGLRPGGPVLNALLCLAAVCFCRGLLVSAEADAPIMPCSGTSMRTRAGTCCRTARMA